MTTPTDAEIQLLNEESAARLMALWQDLRRPPDSGLRDQLILHYSPLVKYVAGRVGVGPLSNIDQADLVSYGILDSLTPSKSSILSAPSSSRPMQSAGIRGQSSTSSGASGLIPRSIRTKARDVERAYSTLEAKLQRSPSEQEVAAELDVPIESLRKIFSQVSFVNVVALDELLHVGGERGDKTTLGDSTG